MFKIEFLRYVKQPMNWIFSFMLPVVLLVLYGLLFEQGFLAMNFFPIMMMSSITIGIVPIAINISLDKFEKRIKHYAIIDGALPKFIFSIFLTNIIICEITSLFLLGLGTLAFGVELSIPNIFLAIFAPIISFSAAFCMALLVATFAKSFAVAMPTALLLQMVILFISGMTVPLPLMTSEFFYIQMLTAPGILMMFFGHINGSALLSTTQLVVGGVLLVAFVAGLVALGSYVTFKLKIRS